MFMGCFYIGWFNNQHCSNNYLLYDKRYLKIVNRNFYFYWSCFGYDYSL